MNNLFFTQQEILEGGTFKLVMSNRPKKNKL